MNARRLTLATLAWCAAACAFAISSGSAMAEGSFQFGSLGSEAGQISFYSSGMAIDQESGAIYISDPYNNRLDEIEQDGEFVRAWGASVLDGKEEAQICTTLCQQGQGGKAAGEFSSTAGPTGVAVDNNGSSDPSNGDVYVVDYGNYRVQKFDPSGKFVLTFGGEVNEKTKGDVCVIGEACKGGNEGTANGEFSWLYSHAYIAVGPGGRVYVGDKARIQIFEPNGTWRENISLAALSSEGKVSALAVNSAGDVFVKDEGVAGVREFEPGGIEMAVKFDEAGGETVEAFTLDALGDLIVSENHAHFGEPCVCHFLEYNSAGEELASFGGHTLASLQSAMVFDNALKELFVFGTDQNGNEEYGHLGVWAFTQPAPGPLVEQATARVSPELRGAATLEATVNPEGSETTVYFEYVDEAHLQTSGYASATSTSPESIGSSFNDQHVVVHLPQGALVPGVKYHWRVVGHNSQGTVPGPDQVFDEIPSAYLEGPWATDVASSSVTLVAKIDPLGVSTSYRIEYGPSTSYGHTFTGNVGEGMGYALVSYHVQELQPDTVYHYRVLTSSEVGTVEGADHTFTTQRAGGEFALPDGRLWELVSPPNKSGSLIEQFRQSLIQAAADGHAIAYRSQEPIGENIRGRGISSQILSSRTSKGWTSQDITLPHELPGEETSPEKLETVHAEYWLFSPDLSQAVAEPWGSVPPLSPEVTERTIYLFNDVTGAYLPLVTPADVPPGTKYGGMEDSNGGHEIHFLAATPDLSHVVLEAPYPLTPEATRGACVPLVETGFCDRAEPWNLYEWSAGRLQLVDILPDGEPLQLSKNEPNGASLGIESTVTAHSVSSDGRWVVWMTGSRSGLVQLYVRDMVGGKTVQIGGRHPLFQTMSSDGSKVFFLEAGELYEFDTATGTQTDLTASHGAAEHDAGVQNAVVGASEDGSYVYFVASSVLASGAIAKRDNLYVLHTRGSEWTTTYVATLSNADSPDWLGTQSCVDRTCLLEQELTTSRVAPNGRYLAFMSNRSLTGYDNVDAVSGQPDEEVYLYDAVAGRVVCASCNPTGARPLGRLDKAEPVVDRVGAWFERWIAGNIPGWYGPTFEQGAGTQYQPRYLSDSGRLFFNSADALAPQDTNGNEDVYQYEPGGVGGCTSASTTFGVRSQGCVSLISSGTSAAESAFMDASENGDDIFFVTASKLTAADYDTTNDVYDAHACTEASPCHTTPVSPPACTSGDSCKSAPSPQPEIFGPAPSATFSGAGNVVGETKKNVVKHKTKTRRKRHVKRRGHRVKKSSGKARTGSATRKGSR
jgi:hypothetical protein